MAELTLAQSSTIIEAAFARAAELKLVAGDVLLGDTSDNGETAAAAGIDAAGFTANKG